MSQYAIYLPLSMHICQNFVFVGVHHCDTHDEKSYDYIVLNISKDVAIIIIHDTSFL